MSADELSVPTCAAEWLGAMGYSPYTAMAGHVARWWRWYTATDGWYTRTRVDWSTGSPVARRFKVESIRPARRVCREWASLMFDEGTEFAAEGPGANEWLHRWAAQIGLLPMGQRCVERAFALGTGALALSFSAPADGPASMRLRRYDARMVAPLSWDEEGVTECAFVTRAQVAGRRVTQAVLHRLDPSTGTYHVLPAMFDAEGRRVRPEGIAEDFDTGQPMPTFCLVKPAVDNLVADMSPMGQSVFEDALGAVRAVDDAFDSLARELAVTKPKVFMSDALLRSYRDEAGRLVAVPMAPEETVVRAVASMSGDDTIKTFQPEIRADALRGMLDTALAELGDLCGFGQRYFTLSKPGGMKTATEVSADSSALMRNLRKHEAAVGAQLSAMLAAACSCAASVLGEATGDAGAVSVAWDDSIIEDTPAEKAQFLSEIAGGISSPWEYRARFKGEDEATARERASEASGAGAAPVAPGAGGL